MPAVLANEQGCEVVGEAVARIAPDARHGYAETNSL